MAVPIDAHHQRARLHVRLTCSATFVHFQGLALLSLSSRLYLIRPFGCGTQGTPCAPHSGAEMGIFYIALYMIAFGNGGYQPNIATFGADQFDEEDPAEAHSKVSFFSYFYLALNLGSLFSNTFLSYIQDKGNWVLGFWASTAAAATALLLFLSGTPQYRHAQPCGNPIGSICQVASAACRNWKSGVSPDHEVLYEGDDGSKADSGGRKLLHTEGFRCVQTCQIKCLNEVPTTQLIRGWNDCRKLIRAHAPITGSWTERHSRTLATPTPSWAARARGRATSGSCAR